MDIITICFRCQGVSGAIIILKCQLVVSNGGIIELACSKAVSYSKLTVVLLEAVKELQGQNASLEARLQALEGRTR